MLFTLNLMFTDPNFVNKAFLSIFKLMAVTGVILYLVFAVVIIRQINVMKKTLITSFSPVIRTLGWIHFGIALFVLFLFTVML